jgi:hypothetical protein
MRFSVILGTFVTTAGCPTCRFRCVTGSLQSVPAKRLRPSTPSG